jgi:hypothetical protein
VLYTHYVYYFQIAGLVLLVAMIGAIVLTLRHRDNIKRQDHPSRLPARPTAWKWSRSNRGRASRRTRGEEHIGLGPTI